MDPFFDHLVQLGVKSYRLDFKWTWVETEKGVFEFDGRGPIDFDNFITRTHNAGIEPLFILDYGNPLYDGGGFPVSAEGQAAFVRFATFVAQQFKGRVKRYEVWNEWNAGLGIIPRVRGDPVVYATLLKRVYAALKAVDPEIVVLGGAAAGMDLDWAQQVFAAGGLTAMDGYSMHPYVYPGAPEKALEWVNLLATTAKTAAGGREIPLYLTEIGWPTYSAADGIAPAVAGDYLARLYLLAPMYAFLKGVWWYDIYDDGTDPTNPQNHFGLFGPVNRPELSGWAPKPASCVMTQVNNLRATYAAVTASRNADGVWVAKYRNASTSTSVFAVWTEAVGATISMRVTSSLPSGATISAQGLCKTVSVTGNGSTSIGAVISNSPMLFTTTGDNILLQR